MTDYGGYRGLFLMSGVKPEAPAGEHILRSDDGKAALWAGAVDDLWKLGKPRGEGGPWLKTKTKAGQPSDPYLLWGYDKRTLTLSQSGAKTATLKVELDLTGTGLWVTYQEARLAAGAELTLEFKPEVQARWLRVTSDAACTATAQLRYD